jgi:sulfonate transport system permease protein
MSASSYGIVPRVAVAHPAPPRRALGWPRLGAVALPWAAPAALLASWALAVASGVVSPQILVSPAQVVRAFAALWSSGELRHHMVRSLFRLFTGFGFGAGLGLAVGLAMGVSRRVEACLAPTFHAARQVPSIALIPLLILILGVDEPLKIVIVAKSSFFPVALAVIQGVKQIPRPYLDVAAVHRISPRDRVLRLVVPAAAPPIVAGLRIALGRSWLVLVASELMAADSGLGQMMEMGRQMFRMDVVMVGVFLTGAIGLVLDQSVRFFERRLAPWKRA